MNESMRALAESVNQLFKQAIPLAKAEVDDILRTGNRDAKRIEHALDMMLDFCSEPEMLFEFKRLCRHYYRIDPQATAEYVHAYRDLWDTLEATDAVPPAPTFVGV